jgi:hypothetical protein
MHDATAVCLFVSLFVFLSFSICVHVCVCVCVCVCVYSHCHPLLCPSLYLHTRMIVYRMASMISS